MIETFDPKVLKQKFTDLQGNTCKIVEFDNVKKILKLKVNKGFATMTYNDFDKWIKKIMEIK